MTCTVFTNLVQADDQDRPAPLGSETQATANRLADVCTACAERLAHHACDTCSRRICKACVVLSSVLTLSFFCSGECREEAELAAEQARETDAYARWG